MALFQFLGKHSKKDKISFSFEPIKRCELPNEFCFHIVVFCAGFLSQCLGGLSQGQVLLVLYFLQCNISKFRWFQWFFFGIAHLCISITLDFTVKNAKVWKIEKFQFCEKKYGSVSCDISSCILVICKVQRGSIYHFDPLNKLFSSFTLSFTLRVQIF